MVQAVERGEDRLGRAGLVPGQHGAAGQNVQGTEQSARAERAKAVRPMLFLDAWAGPPVRLRRPIPASMRKYWGGRA